MEERLTTLEDLVQTQQDVLQQTKEANEQLFQGMLAQIHELLSAYERIMSTEIIPQGHGLMIMSHPCSYARPHARYRHCRPR